MAIELKEFEGFKPKKVKTPKSKENKDKPKSK